MITNVTQYLDRQVRLHSKKIAVRDEKNSLTFEDIYEGAINLADCISEIQQSINKPIIVFCEKSIIQYVAFMGILYSGNYYVPLDIKMPEERLKLIVDLLECDIAVGTTQYKELLIGAGFQGKFIFIEDLNFDKKTLHRKVENKKIIDTDPAYILFTSGSTGIPKGVIISHRAIIDYIEWQCQYLPFDDQVVLGNQAPFYFDASMPDIYTPLCIGATLVIIPEVKFSAPFDLINFINEFNINTLIWVPSALTILTMRDFFAEKKINDLRLVMFCGEVMPMKHLNIWRKYYPDTKFINLYGPTEAAYACAYYKIERVYSDEDTIPIGYACENTDIFVLDEWDRLVEENQEGELCIRGSSLANGYYKDKEKTDQVFVRNPIKQEYDERIYRTGDIVKYNHYGELEFLGRKDFQIKYMGYRIELGEIESVAYGMRLIQQSCVLYDEKYKKIVLFCTASESISESEIYRFLKKRLPKYMLPARIIVIDKMPMNANGKIDRLQLKRLWDEELRGN